MMDREVAIQISGVKKQYRLGSIGGRTLQEDLQSWWAKIQGREDPNLRIGADPRVIGNKFWALYDVDLTIYKGERVGIIGANGAGKSTLLKLISRITAPTEGSIDLYGRVSSMLEVGTGFHGEMTGRENIYMNGAILGMTQTEIDARLEDIIDFSEIREFIDTPVKRYSSGMFVKLAFSVAAHLCSEIMIMDEVLAVGDMAFQHKCLEKMRESAERDERTIIYVSHNMNTIRHLCQRCIVLDAGRIIYDGDVEQAIAVYMTHNLNNNMVDIDLTSKLRGICSSNPELQMVHLKLLNKTMPVYKKGEPLDLALTVEVSEPVENVMLRLTLRTLSDNGIGTAFSEKLSFSKTGKQRFTVRLPLDLIVKGEFYVSIGLYQEGELGAIASLDHITRAFKIEVLGTSVWNSHSMGYVQLPVTTLKSPADC